MRNLTECLLLGFGVVAAAGLPSTVSGDTLAHIRERGSLLWGADAEGGGPYVYPCDADPQQVQGFEVELAAFLASKLGVKAEFRQGHWEKLPELLQRGDVDIVLNGYEWSPVRRERFATTIPYYVYELQTLVRRDDARLTSLNDLRASPNRKPRLAVLGGSAAEAYLRHAYRDGVELVLFEGSVAAMRAVELGINGVDATVQDLPIVTFYEQRFPGLRRLGEPVRPGYYVALTRRNDETLVRALNTAILEGWCDGTIPKILNRYGLWNDTQRRRGLVTDERGSFDPDLPVAMPAENGLHAGPAEGADAVLTRFPLLLQGALVTVVLAVVSMPLAMLAGLVIALGRLYGRSRLQLPLGWYVEVIRGTPLVLQLYVIFFLLPELGLALPPFVAAVLGLSLNYSAYEAEIYRAGLEAIPRGQMEAALSLGMSRPLALRKILIPQAVRLVAPAVMNDFVALFKDTAVCSVITIVELSKQYSIHAQSTGAVVSLGLVTALFYLAMSAPVAALTARFDDKHSTGRSP